MNALTFWQIVSHFGDAPYWIGLAIVAICIYPVLSRQSRHRTAWIIFALLPAMLLSYEIVAVLKEVVALPRPCLGVIPCPSDYSFPSGHAAVAFAFALVTSCMMRKRWLSVLVFFLAVMIALSRVALDYHFMYDAVAGAFIGLGIGFFFYWSYRPIHGYLEKKKLIP